MFTVLCTLFHLKLSEYYICFWQLVALATVENQIRGKCLDEETFIFFLNFL